LLKAPLAPAVVLKVVREVRKGSGSRKPLVVSGARELADALRRELVRDGDPTAVRGGSVEGAAALVFVLAHELTAEDEAELRRADEQGVPVVVVGPEPTTPIPYVLATDVIPLRAGEGFPVAELATLLGGKLDEEATQIAARLPVLRRGIAEALIARVALQNGILGAAIFVPGTDFPVLTLNQLRLVLRLAQAHGQEIDGQRAPEILAVIGGGLGFRALARQALSVVPVAGWAVKGAFAYTGTRALGEAALRYFDARGEGGALAGPASRESASADTRRSNNP
jgi:uncharacterized protein (DUF697 family)